MFDVLIPSRTRRKLLVFFVLNCGESFYLHQLAKEIGESTQAVRAEILSLIRAGFVFSVGTGRQRVYKLNDSCIYLEEIKSIASKFKKSGCNEFNFTNFSRKKLIERNLNDVTSALITKYKPEKIILFGSLARNKVGDSTDIDLLIIKNTDKSYYDRIREVIAICDYNVGIDFFVYTPEELKQMVGTNFFVKEEMIKKGKLVYEKTS